MALKRTKINLKQKTGSDAVEPARDYYPSLYLSNVDLPLAGEQVGKILNVNATLKFTGLSKKEGKKTSYDFEVRSITFVNKL